MMETEQNLIEPDLSLDKIPTLGCNVHLIASDDYSKCAFWLGIIKQGEKKATELLSLPSVEALFKTAEKQGIGEKQPIMMVDSHTNEPHFIYLVPFSQEAKQIDMDAILEVVTNWNSQELGIYIDESLSKALDIKEILDHSLSKLIKYNKLTDIYLLSGSYGKNYLLNVAFQTKQTLKTEGSKLNILH